LPALFIVFEGLDQSGKQTQAELLRRGIAAREGRCELLSFPDYTTPIGKEISRGLHGECEYGPDVMQLLYVANRYEKKPQIESWLQSGVSLVSDRYVASSVAYGEAHGLDPDWLTEIQRFLPPADLTIFLDIEPGTAVQRKAANRDRYERDLAMLSRVRESYRRQAQGPGWVRIDGARSKEAVAADVISVVESRLSPR
jgi:dTMP kinase